MLGICLVLRYGLEYQPGTGEGKMAFLEGILFFPVAYLGTLALYSLLTGRGQFWRAPSFWMLSSLILGALWWVQFGTFYEYWLPQTETSGRKWYARLAYNLHVSFFYGLVPLAYGLWQQQWQATRGYGLTASGFAWKPYGWMLALMAPLLIVASYLPDFQLAYPRYKPGAWEYYQGIWPASTIVGFELSYVWQFVMLELFFRGFMIMALRPFLGEAAVFPMVGVYVFLHFTKPLAETLGSFFGGLVLGTTAFYSGSILGGILVHVGVALLMEALAYGQLWS